MGCKLSGTLVLSQNKLSPFIIHVMSKFLRIVRCSKLRMSVLFLACLKACTREVLTEFLCYCTKIVVLDSTLFVNNLCFCDLGHSVGLVDTSLNGSLNNTWISLYPPSRIVVPVSFLGPLKKLSIFSQKRNRPN